MPGKRACPVRREAIRKRTRPARVPRRMVDPAGSDLREHGHADLADEALSVAFAELRTVGMTTKSACALIGRRGPVITGICWAGARAEAAPAGARQRSGVDAGGTGRGPRADQHRRRTRICRSGRSGPVSWTRAVTCARCPRCTGSPELLVRAVNGAGRRRIRRR